MAPRLKSGSDTPNPLKRIDAGADQSASAGLASQAAVSTADPAGIYERYAAALRASDAVDFDDLILLPIRLLEEHPDVLAATQARYRWISVDEYQDVNAAQYRLLRLLTATGSDNLPRRHGSTETTQSIFASSAIPTRRSTAFAARIGATSCSSSRITPAR